MRFARNSYITLLPKLSFRACIQKPFRDLPDTFWDTALSSLFCFLFLNPQKTSIYSRHMSPGSRIALFGKCSFRIPSGFLPDFTQD